MDALTKSVRQAGWAAFALPIVLALMVIYFAGQSDAFLTGTNMQNIGRALAAVGLLAIGQAFRATCSSAPRS